MDAGRQLVETWLDSPGILSGPRSLAVHHLVKVHHQVDHACISSKLDQVAPGRHLGLSKTNQFQSRFLVRLVTGQRPAKGFLQDGQLLIGWQAGRQLAKSPGQPIG